MHYYSSKWHYGGFIQNHCFLFFSIKFLKLLHFSWWLVKFFSDKGTVYSARAYKIPECSRTAAGTPLVQVFICLFSLHALARKMSLWALAIAMQLKFWTESMIIEIIKRTKLSSLLYTCQILTINWYIYFETCIRMWTLT